MLFLGKEKMHKKNLHCFWEAVRNFRNQGHDPYGTRIFGYNVEYKELFEFRDEAERFQEIVLELYPSAGYDTNLTIQRYGLHKYEVQGSRRKDYM